MTRRSSFYRAPIVPSIGAGRQKESETVVARHNGGEENTLVCAIKGAADSPRPLLYIRDASYRAAHYPQPDEESEWRRARLLAVVVLRSSVVLPELVESRSRGKFESRID